MSDHQLRFKGPFFDFGKRMGGHTSRHRDCSPDLTLTLLPPIVMPKKYKPIPTVPFDALIKGHEGVIEDRNRLGPQDPSVSLIRVLHKEQKPEVIIAIDYRLRALAKLIADGEGKPWTYAIAEMAVTWSTKRSSRRQHARHYSRPRQSDRLRSTAPSS